MNKYSFIAILIYSIIGYSQDKEKNILLDKVISNVKNSEKIYEYLKLENDDLSDDFIFDISNTFDQKLKTKVYSKCKKRNLIKGEVAIIIVDRFLLEKNIIMPYFLLTEIQNCTFETCIKNSNLIEYYFDYIKDYTEFKTKFQNWYGNLIQEELIEKYKLRTIKKLLSNHLWETSENSKSLTYAFRFNKLNNKKGVFVVYNQKKEEIINETPFRINKNKNELEIYFGKTNISSKINKLNKFELIIDNKKYNYVLYCW